MAVVLKWLRAFRLSYWRRCKACGVRGSKCLCRRPSLAMEQIFFQEERKHCRFGVRNFSHVSDTAITASTTSTTNLTNNISFAEDYRAGDFYRATQQAHQQQSSSTALVRKNSGTMVPVRGNHQYYSNDDTNHLYNSGSGEYGSYYGSGMDRYDGGARVARHRRQLPPSRSTGTPATVSSSRHQHQPHQNNSLDDAARSIQVYNRRQASRALSSSRSSARQSTADSVIVRPSNCSSTARMSGMSDRMSIDNNMGSFDPRSRYYEGSYSYAPSIQEDEDDVQLRLNGLLQLPSPASSTSTILERSRYPQYY